MIHIHFNKSFNYAIVDNELIVVYLLDKAYEENYYFEMKYNLN